MLSPVTEVCLIITAAASFAYSISLQNLIWERERHIHQKMEQLLAYEKELRSSILIQELIESNALFEKPLTIRPVSEDCTDCS